MACGGVAGSCGGTVGSWGWGTACLGGTVLEVLPPPTEDRQKKEEDVS